MVVPRIIVPTRHCLHKPANPSSRIGPFSRIRPVVNQRVNKKVFTTAAQRSRRLQRWWDRSRPQPGCDSVTAMSNKDQGLLYHQGLGNPGQTPEGRWLRLHQRVERRHRAGCQDPLTRGYQVPFAATIQREVRSSASDYLWQVHA